MSRRLPLSFNRVGKASVRLLSGSPFIVLTRLAYDKIRCLVTASTESEVAFLGLVAHDGMTFTIEDIFVVEQTASPKHATLKGSAITALLDRWAVEDGDAGWERMERLYFWGQSHLEMEICPSSVDDDTFRRKQNGDNAYFIQGIFNRNGDWRFDLFIREGGIVIENVPCAVADDLPPELVAWAERELREKVTVGETPAEIREQLITTDGMRPAEFGDVPPPERSVQQ